MLLIRRALFNNNHTFRQLISLPLSTDLSTVRLNVFCVFILISKVKSRRFNLSCIIEHYLLVLLLESGIAVRSMFEICHLDIRSKIGFSVLVFLDVWPLRGFGLTLLHVGIFCF